MSSSSRWHSALQRAFSWHKTAINPRTGNVLLAAKAAPVVPVVPAVRADRAAFTYCPRAHRSN